MVRFRAKGSRRQTPASLSGVLWNIHQGLAAHSGARAPPDHLVGMNSKQRLPMGRGIARRERVGIGRSKDGHGGVVARALFLADVRLEEIDGSVNDDALPIETA